MVWGKMMLESNGLSYMGFKVHVDVNKAMDGMLKERSVDNFFVLVVDGIVLVLLSVLGWLECPQ